MSVQAAMKATDISALVWDYMRDLYGGVWIRDHGAADERGTWGVALSRYHPAQIRQAVADLLHKYPSYPPTLAQFKALVAAVQNPDEPLQLAAPNKITPEEDARQWLEDIGCMIEEAYSNGPLSDEERDIHMRVIGRDEETIARKAKRWVEPGSHGSCALNGCASPGVFTRSTNGAGRWYCADHFSWS